ncbi:hydroxyisourate hydrolase [Calidifontibacter terrae]
MGTLSTHVLDTSRGKPAQGVRISLETLAGDALDAGVTDADGRVGQIGADVLPAGDYRLVFAAKDYFAELGVESFYPQIAVAFTIADSTQHYHVPILLNPFGFSTYRGS